MAPRRFTLTQRDILALTRAKSTVSATIVSVTPRGNGVEYDVQLDNNAGALWMTADSESGASLLGVRLSGADSFALRFTLLDPTPDPRAVITAGAAINMNDSSQTGERIVRLGENGRTEGVASTPTEASTTRTVGFTFYIAPRDAKFWPETGGRVRILVEPAPGASPIAAVGPAAVR
jgi:hypothetical protein